MADPLFDTDAPKRTVADAFPGIAVADLGAVGAPTVIGALVLDRGPTPTAFLAATSNT